MDSEKNVKEIADKRAEYERTKELSKSQKVTFRKIYPGSYRQKGNLKSLSWYYQNRCPKGSLEGYPKATLG